MSQRTTWATLLAAAALFVSSCSQHPKVSAKKCGKIVSHARKLLGNQADPASKLMKDCKAASASERGCALNAKSAADLLRCSM